MLQLTVARAGGMKRQGGGQLRLSDFLPDFAIEREEMSSEAKQAQLKTAFRAMAAKAPKKQDGKK